MNARWLACVSSSVVLVVVGTGGWSAEHWRTFQSKGQHFSVRYPASWHRLGAGQFEDPDVLGIINFPNSERIKGVVIKAGGAEIQVTAAPLGVSTPAEWIGRDVLDDPIIRERDVLVPKSVSDGCTALREVIWRNDVSGSGKAYQFNTGYYCSTAAGLYSVVLTTWEGDPKQGDLQSVALTMALSLRVCQ